MVFIEKIVNRVVPPVPLEEGENIPWNEPGFSKRMLEEHLSQDHDLASRRKEIIDEHVRWIFEEMLGSRPGRVLDLGCGPGFYTGALARLGCSCVGVDFSPASIEYAKRVATADGLDCEYVLGDVRETAFGEGFDLVMMIYGQINVFKRADATKILGRMCEAARPGGTVLLEPQTYAQVRGDGGSTSSWYTASGGLFSKGPHLVLQEGFFDEESSTRTERFHVLRDSEARVESHVLTTVAYEDGQLEEMMAQFGLVNVEQRGSLSPGLEANDDGTRVLFGLRTE